MSEKQTGFLSRSIPVQAIYAYMDQVPAARLRAGHASAPDILHGSYLISEQSPASSHNTPVLSHTRSFNIPIYRPYVKKKFSISAKIFGIFFVQVYEINFGGNRGRRGVRRKICGTAQRPSRIHYLWCVLSFLPCSYLYSGDPFPQCAHWGLSRCGSVTARL